MHLEFPQLRLEDLTHQDISKYVEAQLRSHARFQDLLRCGRMNAENLISQITHKAAGVFLWVRLVVRDLLRGLRDGDGLRELQKRLEDIPSHLNHYFKRLMDSISPHQRQEASALLQIALHKDEFVTGHHLRLIDLSFIDEGRPDFAISGQYNFRDLNLADPDILQFRLDSAIRRLNSRCMGLLECREAIYPRGFNLLRPFKLTVCFLHRSCRDFLLSSEIQSLLHQYTQGPYYPRMFLINSRLSQFVAFEAANADKRFGTTVASYLLSALSLPTYKYTPTCRTAAAIIQPILEKFIQNRTFDEAAWYIDPSIVSWNEEQSSFLTLAIDFDLSSYVRAHLTSEYVRRKRGRPVLDYILRPRFAWVSDWIGVGNRKPSLELLEIVLRLGADPNEIYGSTTVWPLFLCFIVDFFAKMTDDNMYVEYSGALEMLIRAGATPLLPKSLLTQKSNYKHYCQYELGMNMSPEELFSYRWPGVVPAMEQHPDRGTEPVYAVSDLLERFRSRLGLDVNKLSSLLYIQYEVGV